MKLTVSRAVSWRLCAIALACGIAGLASCVAPKPPPPPPPVVVLPPPPVAGHPLSSDSPDFLRLPNLAPGQTPVRVGVILPFGSSTAATRNLAAAMLKAAQLALYDSKNSNIVLITADEGSKPDDAAAAADKLLAQGAEVIIGPLFGPSVSAVAPIARDRAVPVLAFSTEKSVAGNGAYLLSFLPQSEVNRVVAYAASQGHHDFAAMVPQNEYGDVIAGAFADAVKSAGGDSVDVEHFTPSTNAVMAPSGAVAKTKADAVMIAQGGPVLRAIAPSLSFSGLDRDKVKLLGTGLWDDPAIVREDMLLGGWFAAPEPNAVNAFNSRFHDAFGTNPPQLASLAYDAIALVALLSGGQPYHRFTQAALMDPNGFSGVDGIFRFNTDGTSERGLAVLEVAPDGFHVVSPPPKTFQPSAF
ncbi:MAG TPA: penicillin-binding protein activator [Rhizomicrobium sp.]|jgi:branched-chain amino acid transport system substrate-binding protein|nr:penicillin-binding protein activator [Rhizomicrobium sp.]